MTHRHLWRLNKVVACRAKDRNFAVIHLSCACGAKKRGRSKSRIVVEAARRREKDKT